MSRRPKPRAMTKLERAAMRWHAAFIIGDRQRLWDALHALAKACARAAKGKRNG